MSSQREQAESSIHQVWWTSLCDRMQAVQANLPAKLAGSIQFVAAPKDDEQPEFFYLSLNGTHSTPGIGLLPSSDTFVEIDKSELAKLLIDDEEKASAFRVVGNYRLFEELYAALNTNEAPKSLLETLAQR